MAELLLYNNIIINIISIVVIIVLYFYYTIKISLLLLLFFYPRYLESRGLKAYSKNSWNGHLSGSHTQLSRRRMELKRWIVIYSKALEKKGGFTKIIRLGADIATKSRNERDG